MRVNYNQRIAIEEACCQLVNLLMKSNESAWTTINPFDTAAKINDSICDMATHGVVDHESLLALIGPTASIQEISIDNGWGDQFLNIAERLKDVLHELKTPNKSLERGAAKRRPST